jgi:hypothetical protein
MGGPFLESLLPPWPESITLDTVVKALRLVADVDVDVGLFASPEHLHPYSFLSLTKIRF